MVKKSVKWIVYVVLGLVSAITAIFISTKSSNVDAGAPHGCGAGHGHPSCPVDIGDDDGGDGGDGDGGNNVNNTRGTYYGGDDDDDDDGDGGCFPGSSIILLKGGLCKMIKNILPGDVVVGKNGKLSTVKGLIKHDGKNYFKNDFKKFPLLRVFLKNKKTLDIVEGHPVYVFNKNLGQIEAKRYINIGDQLLNSEGVLSEVVLITKNFDYKNLVFELDLGTLRNSDLSGASYFVNDILVDEYTLTKKENYLAVGSQNKKLSLYNPAVFLSKIIQKIN